MTLIESTLIGLKALLTSSANIAGAHLNIAQFRDRNKSLEANPCNELIPAIFHPRSVQLTMEIVAGVSEETFPVGREILARELARELPHFKVLVDCCEAGENRKQTHQVDTGEKRSICEEAYAGEET